MTTVKDIIIERLRAMGADGLCYPYDECGCGIDDHLMTCGGDCSNCIPAKKIPTPQDHELYRDCDYIYVPLDYYDSI